jgi:hypothetical protein
MKKRIVEVTWMDAYGEISASREKVDSCNPSDFLVPCKTYGILYKEDNNAVLLLTEDSANDVDIAVIPKPWILKGGIKTIKYINL